MALDAEQLHVSPLGGDIMAVSWASASGQLAHVQIQRLGLNMEPVPGSERNYRPQTVRYDILCGQRFAANCRLPARYSSPLLLHAHVPVEPAVRYRFRLASNQTAGTTPWRNLKGLPKRGDELKVAVIGDLGQTAFSEATCRDVAKVHRSDGLDLGVLLGDLSYADTNASRWDSFQRMFDTSGCADIPWVVLPGNHEIEPDEITGEPFLPFRSRWRTPQYREATVSAPPQDAWQGWLTYDFPSMSFDFGSSFFSLEVGCVHLLVLNPYTDASPSSPQIAWLQSELKRINRSETEHVAVLTHAPWHHSSVEHRPEREAATRNLLSAAGPLLLPDKTDLVFSGHVHAFERSLPIDGVQHFVVGHGGNREELYDNWLPSSTSAFHAGDHYGWGLLHLRPRRLGPSTFKARRGADGAVMDAVEFWPRDSAPSQPGKEDQGGVPGPAGLLGATAACLVVCCLCAACFYRRARVRARYEEKTALRRETVTIGVMS
ncbi:PAP22 [Symbiodinium microadriaticum]|nr:PAP22 [Symbiodinium microadriaticum]